MQDEANLIGERRTTRGSVGAKLRLVKLDEVLRLSARAVETVVEPLRRAIWEIGDDKADIEAEPRRFDAIARRSLSQDLARWRVSA